MTNKINKLHGVLIEDAELTERVKKLEEEGVSGEKLDMLVDQINDYINETDETIEKINDDFQTLTNTAVTLNNKIKIIDEGAAETVSEFKTTYDLTTLYTGTDGNKFYRVRDDVGTLSEPLKFPSFIIYNGNKYFSTYLSNYEDNNLASNYNTSDYNKINYPNGLILDTYCSYGYTRYSDSPTEQYTKNGLDYYEFDDNGNCVACYRYYKVVEPSA